MRPNLMSPRRAALGSAGEDSILAMLEREPARRRKGGAGSASGARLAWYGASAAVAMALTGTLVWLAANNDGLRPDVHDMVLAEAGKAAQRPAPVPPPALRPVALTPEPQHASAAVIVDGAPTPEGGPPLRLLKPAPALAAEPKPAARPALPAARPKPVLAARSVKRPAPPKTTRAPAPARAPDAPVDADVALISAVIVHANGHAPPGSQMTELLCPNDNCKARPARQ